MPFFEELHECAQGTDWVVSANTTNTFKTRLDKFWHNQDIIYNFRAQLQGTGSRSEFSYEKF